ncbi:hypothetical protein EYR36_007956 [Pleurotus pulmonarius]|nr:hypothetical protein EYR36_007956 [Pleurotus pulmonarius]
MDIALDKASILALFFETLLYGIYLVLFCLMLLVVLLRKESGKTQRHRLVPLSIVMMIIATTSLIIDLVRAIQAFVVKDGKQIDAIAYYSAISHPLHLAEGVLYVTQTILGDAIMIWRCYRSTQVIFLFAIRPSQLNENMTRTRSPLIKRTRLTPVLLAFVESGALYASSLLALMIAYASGSNGQYAVLNAVTPLVGITFCLIVLQIQFHLTSNVWNTNGPITINTISVFRASKQHEGEGREEHTFAYPMQPLAVYVRVEQGHERNRSLDEYSRARSEGPATSCTLKPKATVQGE